MRGDECQRLLAGGDGAFELCVFSEGEHRLELRRGPVAGGDKAGASKERSGAVGFRWLGFVLGAGEVVEAKVAVGGAGVEVVEGEVLVEAGEAEEAFEGGLLHVEDVAEAHVVFDEGEDLGGVFVGEAEAGEDDLGDADSGFYVVVEADSVVGDGGVWGLVGCWFADVVEECCPG